MFLNILVPHVLNVLLLSYITVVHSKKTQQSILALEIIQWEVLWHLLLTKSQTEIPCLPQTTDDHYTDYHGFWDQIIEPSIRYSMTQANSKSFRNWLNLAEQIGKHKWHYFMTECKKIFYKPPVKLYKTKSPRKTYINVDIIVSAIQ